MTAPPTAVKEAYKTLLAGAVGGVVAGWFQRTTSMTQQTIDILLLLLALYVIYFLIENINTISDRLNRIAKREGETQHSDDDGPTPNVDTHTDKYTKGKPYRDEHSASE